MNPVSTYVIYSRTTEIRIWLRQQPFYEASGTYQRSSSEIYSYVNTTTSIYHWHYPRLTKHPGESCTYDSMERENYWSKMASNVYATVRYCCKRDRNKPANKIWLPLQLFPSFAPIGFVAKGTFGPRPKEINVRQFVLVLTDRCSKVMRIVPVSKKTVSHIWFFHG